MRKVTRVKAIPIGVDNFKEVIENDYYYVDKTKAIEELIDSKAKIILYTRPRRFGKTLFISMLDNFFNIEKNEDNKTLFSNLYISKSKCFEYLGKYPVIRLDFKDLKGNTYESFTDVKDLNNLLNLLLVSGYVTFDRKEEVYLE